MANEQPRAVARLFYGMNTEIWQEGIRIGGEVRGNGAGVCVGMRTKSREDEEQQRSG